MSFWPYFKEYLTTLGSLFPRCSNRANRQPWDVLTIAKRRIIDFVESPTSVAKAGVRIGALKFIQRVILVQTRGISDPRVSTWVTYP
jgi:symplekin